MVACPWRADVDVVVGGAIPRGMLDEAYPKGSRYQSVARLRGTPVVHGHHLAALMGAPMHRLLGRAGRVDVVPCLFKSPFQAVQASLWGVSIKLLQVSSRRHGSTYPWQMLVTEPRRSAAFEPVLEVRKESHGASGGDTPFMEDCVIGTERAQVPAAGP